MNGEGQAQADLWNAIRAIESRLTALANAIDEIRDDVDGRQETVRHEILMVESRVRDLGHDVEDIANVARDAKEVAERTERGGW